MIKIGICNTEPEFIDVLEKQMIDYCQKEGVEIHIDKYTNSKDFHDDYSNHQFHFTFVDMDCHYLNGSMIDYLRNYRYAVFIVPNFEDARYAYQCDAFDYICKKETHEQLEEALQNIIQRMVYVANHQTIKNERH